MRSPFYSTRREQYGGRGTTLIELLIVVAVLAIIGLFVLLSGRPEGATRLSMAARRLVSDLEYAQARSIGDAQDPCVVVFTPGENSYFLARHSSPSVPIVDPATQSPYVVRLGFGAAAPLGGVSVDSVSLGGDDRLAFDAQGALDEATNAQIVLRFGDDTLRIVVDADTGEPSIP